MNTRARLFFFSLLLGLLIALPAQAGKKAVQPAPDAPEAKTNAAFNTLDTNKDGKISFDEYMKGWYKAGADKIVVKTEELDANKDGQVTWEEMRIHFKKKYDEVDVNKDGYISRKEAVVLFNF